MDEPKKLKIQGAKKSKTPLSIEALTRYAEAVIRQDKDAALKAQQHVSDLVAPSNDKEMTKVNPLSLSEFKSNSQSVAIKTPNDILQDNLVLFSPKKKT